MNSTSSSLMSESCWPAVPFLVTLFASCSINCWRLMPSCSDSGVVGMVVGVGVGVVKLAVIFGSIGGTDVSTGSGAVWVGCRGADGIAPATGGMLGFTFAHCDVFGIVSSTGLPDTGTTVCAPATPRAISCNACACKAFTKNACAFLTLAF